MSPHNHSIRRRVGLVGYGAIGEFVGRALLARRVPGMRLTGVVADRGAPEELAVPDLDTLVQVSDVLVEAAGPTALRELAPHALETGRTLVALSTGAFLDPEMWSLLGPATPPGRLILSTGAIGGLDLVRAARLAGGDVRVELRTTKQPRALVQPWMDEAERGRLTTLTEHDDAVTVFTGGAVEAAELFPANLNVAAALAIAAGAPTAVRVDLVADAAATRTRHEVMIRSDVGDHRLTIENRPSASNPATSALVPWAVLRCLHDLSAESGAGFL